MPIVSLATTHPDKVLLRGLGEPEAIANVGAFLAGDEAGCIHGAVIEVSGGMTVWRRRA
jgi:NAD(P)-dependent dehydrogenase (short-subunit alcohol dehydrogenase family)